MTSDDYKLPGSRASLPVLPTGAGHEQVHHQAAVENKPAPIPADLPPDVQRKLLEGKIIAAISTVYDPEIPVNVYELGLIYGIEIAADNAVSIRMTLTAPGCPVAGSLPREVEKAVEAVDEVKEAEVVLVWDPPWDKSRMSEVALLQLGM